MPSYLFTVERTERVQYRVEAESVDAAEAALEDHGWDEHPVVFSRILDEVVVALADEGMTARTVSIAGMSPADYFAATEV